MGRANPTRSEGKQATVPLHLIVEPGSGQEHSRGNVKGPVKQ